MSFKYPPAISGAWTYRLSISLAVSCSLNTRTVAHTHACTHSHTHTCPCTCKAEAGRRGQDRKSGSDSLSSWCVLIPTGWADVYMMWDTSGLFGVSSPSGNRTPCLSLVLSSAHPSGSSPGPGPFCWGPTLFHGSLLARGSTVPAIGCSQQGFLPLLGLWGSTPSSLKRLVCPPDFWGSGKLSVQVGPAHPWRESWGSSVH